MTTTAHKVQAPPAPGEFEELVQDVRAAARVLWRRRALALGSACAVAALGALLVPLVPERHEASARLVVDTQSPLKPLISGMTVQSAETERQARLLARKVVASPQLSRLLDRGGLGLPVGSPQEREDSLVKLIARTRLTADENGIHTVSWRDTDPARALRVVQGLVELFLEVGEGEKRREVGEASRFLKEQVQAAETRLMEAERRLTDYKVRHFGVTGVSKEDHFARTAALQDALSRLRAELGAAEQTREAYRAELLREDPQLPLDLELTGRRKALDEMLQRLGDQHPDVLAAREAIQRIEEQRRERERDPDPSRAGSPTNPVYQRIRGQLAEAEAQAAALRSRVAVAQRRLQEVRAAADRAPEVESELAQLGLEVEFARKTYDQLLAKGESATLGLKADESSRGAEFRVIEPARAGAGPVFPGHAELGWLSVLLTLAAGLVVPLAVERLNPTFEDARALARATGRPVLGEISAWPRPAVQDSRAQALRLVAGVGALVVLQGLWMAWLQHLL
jgi:polysaccharide chain length determinant protein (PEP-CTERM system associated)